MLLFDLEDYVQTRWYGVGNQEVPCAGWEDGYTTSRATWDASEKALDEILQANPVQLVIGKDDQLVTELDAILLEMWETKKTFLFNRWRFWNSQQCRCSIEVSNQNTQAEMGELCAQIDMQEKVLESYKLQYLEIEGNMTIPAAEKAKLLAALQEEIDATNSALQKIIASLTSLLQAATSSGNLIFEAKKHEFYQKEMGNDAIEGECWAIDDRYPTTSFVPTGYDPLVIEDGRIVFQESYYTEYKQSFEAYQFAIKKWMSKVWGWTHGEGDVTAVPPANGYAIGYYPNIKQQLFSRGE